jgi:hypothetical protein
MTVTADSTLWTADTLCVTADGRIVCIDAEVVEPVNGSVTADTTAYSADNTFWPTADGGAAGATDRIDAVVESAQTVVGVGGGYYRPRWPVPVIGVGDGYVSAIIGEAHGVVIDLTFPDDAASWATDDLDELVLLLALAA